MMIMAENLREDLRVILIGASFDSAPRLPINDLTGLLDDRSQPSIIDPHVVAVSLVDEPIPHRQVQ
jgi:hypothetical protein